MAKMDWLVKELNENKNYKYRIAETGQNFGTVCMPTGYGKSGVIFEDIVYQIRNWKRNDKPLIINLSSPILKLTQQTINDMLQTLSQLSGIDRSLFHFYICSSDCGESYEELKNIGVRSEDFEKQPADSFREICLVATCHKSLWKFIDKFANFDDAKNIYTISSYLDEAHKIAILPDEVDRTKSEKVFFQYKRTLTVKEYEELSDEEKGYYKETTKKQLLNRLKEYCLIQNKVSENTVIDLDLMETFSTKIYAVTATPNSEITDELYSTQNGRNRVWGEKARKQNHKKVYTIFVPATQAINEDIICPPLVKIVPSKADSITITLLEDLMQEAIKTNPNIKHKILVTLRTTEEVKNIRDELERLGNKVFSTDSRNGFGEEEDINSIQDFTKEVEEFGGNCFVLHIRQLIEGIDISGLTDCVIFTNAENHNLNKQDYKRYVQTIGRTLRLGKERGISKDKRLKNSANVYFVTKNETQLSQFRNFVNSYYGYGNVHFFEAKFESKKGEGDDGKEELYTGSGFDFDETLDSETTVIEKLWMSTKEELDKLREMILKLPNKSYVFEKIYGICMAHQGEINGEFDTEDYLYNRDIQTYLFDKVGNYLEDINGNPKGWRELCEKRSKKDE